METLLSEAVYLIKSLETDRAEAEQALKQQKSRKKRISMKIDSWSIWKLQELPTAVQKGNKRVFPLPVSIRVADRVPPLLCMHNLLLCVAYKLGCV